MEREKEFIMNVKIKKKFIIIMILIVITILIWTVNQPLPYEPQKELVDTSIMGEEIPVKIISLNSYIKSDENYEIAYLLGDKGNLYVLCYDTKKYYVDLWHPEFWKNINVVDICAGRPWLYAAALDQEGRVYVWNKEYLFGEGETEPTKREDWKIYQLENAFKIDAIFAAHDQFVIATEEEKVYRWYPKENVNPNIDDMEMIEMETMILNVAASEEVLFILDKNNVLWSVESGTKNFLKENVRNIMQCGRGLAIQMLDNENKIYIHNLYLLQEGYETETFAGKYEVSEVAFDDKIMSLSVSNVTVVVCTDKNEFYQWGKKKVGYRYVAVPYESVYKEPIKINLEEIKYYMLIGTDIVYLNEENELFVYK